ncbi:MAG TPA: alpha/beta hydrolase [Streptosporangiaceae bacterium]|nr:alpha/beta hydrolase [Streptosporangiaceae bacterium]
MASEFRRREIANDEVRLSYLDNDADGPVIVALHGLAGTGDEFIATASAAGGSYRFVLPDLRGHGHSTRRPADVSRAAFVDDVAAVIRHVSPDRPVTLVGQSMGGHTAILAAASFPALIGRLIVVEATVAVGVDPARIGDYFRSWPAPFPSVVEAREFLGEDALAQSWIGHLEPLEDGRLVPSFDADVMQRVMEGVSDPRWEEWKSVTAPTTAVFATKSMFSTEEQAAFVAGRPGTRHIVLPGGSHDAHLDATAEWTTVLTRALEE